MSDDNTGFDVIPDRYTTKSGREKIDLIRDSMSDREFAIGHCLGAAMKYDDREKGSDDPEKRRWYIEMSNHVLNGTTDPRHNRPEFRPYKRASLPTPIPGRRINVLDHGFVRFVEDWGEGEARMPEAGIIEAARQSTQGSFRGWKQDKRLLDYLYSNKHSTPFEFAGMVLEVRAPIFVFRQWHRHRTQSYNEMSARYEPLPALDYLPTMTRVMDGALDTSNKQAAGFGDLSREDAVAFRYSLERHNSVAQSMYERDLKNGVPKELARLYLTTSRYSQMRVSVNLRNWLGFLTLRMDPHAQWEIRQYANAVFEQVETRFPQTAALFQGQS